MVWMMGDIINGSHIPALNLCKYLVLLYQIKIIVYEIEEMHQVIYIGSILTYKFLLQKLRYCTL